jgi:hypothetical protein
VTRGITKVHLLLPKMGGFSRLACHLKAAPGGYTTEVRRVTCPFCLNRPEYRKLAKVALVAEPCACGHRRGRHVGKDGLGGCVEDRCNCVSFRLRQSA